MSLRTSMARHRLELDRPFTISRGTTATTETVSVTVQDEGGTEGVGAAAPSAHYGETADTVTAVLPELLEAVERVGDPLALGQIERALAGTVGRNPAAKAAVSIACHDLAAKRLGLPLYRLWGEDPTRAPATSFTVGIDEPDAMAEAAAEAVAAGHDILKIKLGTADDRARLRAVREAVPEVRLRVDANEAWTPREAVRATEWLADYGVTFVEQPVPASDRAGLQHVYERGALPIAVDESVEVATDVSAVADRADIIVVKLMKCGGLREARRIVHTARAHDLEVMCGCMVESNASIAAAWHLGPLLDYADLDGSLLLAEDPFEGIPLDGGTPDLAPLDRPGTGARER
ncbi:MAG: dipeptide epimerase [Halobacteriaceae archaeon]